ncbi:MAG: helix-turn-helix transcriptional regulator [Williamsia sp.]|nr:helix-turn-helix transcriptional regulator [Williamsia sp.]
MAKPKTDQKAISEAQCKATLNAVADALYAIGGKWKLKIVVALMHGDKRFNELQRLIEGISAKMLSTELKELEINGFVKRHVFTGKPVVVTYELTAYAETLDAVLQTLSEWGTMHREKVKKSMKKTRPAEAL